jgi:hypothetical protein
LTFVERDLVNHTLTYLVAHFTEFGLFGNTSPTAIGKNEEPVLNRFPHLPTVIR